MYDTDDESYYRYRDRRVNWLGYAIAFGAGVLIGALLFSRGCLCAPEEEPAETAATAETAAEVETAEEAPATAEVETAETALTAEEEAVVFEEPRELPPPTITPARPPTPTKPPTTTREVTPRPTGKGLGPAEINRVITKRLPSIQSEYNSLLKSNPSLGGGKVTVRFVISSSGSVTSAEIVEDTLGNGELRAGILRRVRTWKFPRASGDSTVVYPFVFVASAR